MSITPDQLKRLQVLYAQLARHTLQAAQREERLAWASQLCGRRIASFSGLTLDEGRHLIDTLQSQLGVKVPPKRKRLDRDQARRAGTEGRRNQDRKEATLAGPSGFARIQYALDLLGWNQAQFDGWLRSPRSPLGKKSDPKIRTLGDANRVWWALKKMAQGRGLWKDEHTFRGVPHICAADVGSQPSTAAAGCTTQSSQEAL